MADYTPRIGVAVSTKARTCIAIHNPGVAAESPVTIVSLTPPQTFGQGRITGTSSSACPVSKDLDPSLSSYEIKTSGPDLPKLTPLIGIIGGGTFTTDKNNVAADLNGDGGHQYFRACGDKNGVHLTVWSGEALLSTLIWHGFYYDPPGASTFPTCSAKELAGL